MAVWIKWLVPYSAKNFQLRYFSSSRNARSDCPTRLSFYQSKPHIFQLSNDLLLFTGSIPVSVLAKRGILRQTDLNIHDFLSFVNHGRTRLRNCFNVITPICKTLEFQASYFNRIVNLWNFTYRSVPKGSLSLIDVFKNFLKQTLTSLLRATFGTWSLARAHAIVHSAH